ncbi:MAG: MFS transporter [Nostocoides sp.]
MMPRSTAPTDLEALGRRGRLRVLMICSLSLAIVGMDVTAVNLALPSIRSDFNAGLSGLQWVIDAYTVVVAALLIFSGSVADRVGRKKVFRVGLAVFGLGSLACSLAPSIGVLVAARALQAVGGSMLNPVAMSIITNTFLEPSERARAIGVWGAMFGTSMAVGPVIGGILVDGLGWRSIFWLNVPIVAAALWLTARYVPESRADHPRRLDPWSQILVATSLAALVFAIIEGENLGWRSPAILAAFGTFVLVGVVFLVVQWRAREPLVDPRYFGSIPFTGALASAVVGFAGNGATLFMATLYLQTVRGMTPLDAGLSTVPMAIMTASLAPVSGWLVARRGTRLPMVAAGTLLFAGAVPLFHLAADTPLEVVIGAFVLFGAGQGLLNAPITNSAVSGMPRAQAGVAGALASTARQVGAALGVAIAGALMATQLASSATAELAVAMRPGWVLTGACGLVLLVMGFLVSGNLARSSVARVVARTNADLT